MTFLNSLWFNLVFYTANLVLCAGLSWAMLLPRKQIVKAVEVWLGSIAWIESHFCGIKYRVVGRENIPEGAFILASKHQSAWETFKIHLIVKDPAIVLKRELLRIPLVGWWMKRSGSIAIDRKAGAQSILEMVAAARKAAAEGRPIVIFPEGTRAPVGKALPYKSGVAALYQELNLPVVPMALNSGVLWSRDSFFKKRGTITVELLPQIPAGLHREEMMHRLRETLEPATARLVKEA
ncbi:MAG: lysophospholipid acyltransferase family protein [Alphaproteobacteria bacterium]|nr:lysophospholipid acyltransferase family protein [Alphaproteobacteria bacterium]